MGTPLIQFRMVFSQKEFLVPLKPLTATPVTTCLTENLYQITIRA